MLPTDRIPKKKKSSLKSVSLTPCPLPGYFHPLQNCEVPKRLLAEEGKCHANYATGKHSYSKNGQEQSAFKKCKE